VPNLTHKKPTRGGACDRLWQLSAGDTYAQAIGRKALENNRLSLARVLERELMLCYPANVSEGPPPEIPATTFPI
jgi:hypothetical protein